MCKSVFITLCLFILSRNVYSLICFVSDFESLKLGNVKKLNHTLQDCDNYNNRTKYLSQELQIPENVLLRCYTVELSRDVVFKGCVQKGGCMFLGDAFRDIAKRFSLDIGDDSGITECRECSTHHCNTNILSELRMEPTYFAYSVPKRGETSLNCYYCPEPCHVTNARENICGENIGKSQEAVCSTEIAKNSVDSGMAIRKCQIVRKDTIPQCPENSICTFCKSDLCNNDPKTTVGLESIGANRSRISWASSGKNMVKVLLLALIAAAFALQQSEAALKCYHCFDACEASTDKTKTCGQTIGDSQEAVCTTEVANESKTPKVAVRKCQIVQKGAEPACPANTKCTTCKTELCNSAPSNMAMVGVVVACLAAKFLH